MSSQFDELAKDLAGGMSRREALRRFGLGLVGALLTSLGLGGLAPRPALGQNNCNSNCFYFCKAIYPNDSAAQAACQGSGGLCFQCGPCATARRSLCGAPGASSFCCNTGESCCNNSSCFNLQTNFSNCGACGHACTSPSTACCSGVCKNTNTDLSNCGMCGHVCGTGFNACCSGSCSNTNTDANNCGACGHPCGPGQSCCSGVCKNTSSDASNCGACGHHCDEFETCCSGSCKNTFLDAHNCGACGNICPTPAHATVAFCFLGHCAFFCQFGYIPSGGQCVPFF